MTTMSLLGPALGGLMATTIGPGWGYVLNLGTFVFSLSLLALLGSHQPVATETESQLAMLREGARYVRSRVDIVGSYVVDIIAMAFAYPVIMLPFVAARYHEHWALSLLYMALPFGALAAQLFNKWTHHVHRYGQAIVYSSMVWGLGIAVFGWFNPLWIVFTGLALAGAADSYSATFRQTLWNESILPEIRGRMGGVELISYAVGPLAGQFRSGAMTSWLGLRSSLALGGVACAIGDGVAGLGLPALWRFDERTDVHVAAVRTARQHDTESEHS
jgi:MFS family permease